MRGKKVCIIWVNYTNLKMGGLKVKSKEIFLCVGGGVTKGKLSYVSF